MYSGKRLREVTAEGDSRGGTEVKPSSSIRQEAD